MTSWQTVAAETAPGATPAMPWWRRQLQAAARRVRTEWRPVSVDLRPQSGQRAASALVLDHAAALAEWAQWCAQNAGSHCALSLSGHWLLSAVAPAGQSAPQWEHYLGLGASTLSDQWVTRSLSLGEAELSCAAPRALIDELRAVARQHGVRLSQVNPWWASGLQHWLQAHASNEGGGTLSAFEPGLLTHFRSGPDPAGKPVLDQCWTEVIDPSEVPLAGPAMLVAPSPAAAQALLSSATLPPNRSGPRPQPHRAVVDALDFIGPRIRTALASWAVLVLGLAACMAVGDQARQATAELDEAQATLRRLERAKHQQTLAKAPPRTQQAASGPAIDRKALKSASQVAKMLAFPWPAVVDRVEQAAARQDIVLTSFSLDVSTSGTQAGARPQVRLQGAVRDDASALRWLDLQGVDAQLLSRQPLNTPFDTTKGHYAWRVEAVWPLDLSNLGSAR